MCKGIPFTVEISALAGMELGMTRLAGQRFNYSYRGSYAETIMRPGKGKVSRRGYFFLLTSSFHQYNWLSSPLSQVKIARRWKLWGWGASRPRYSLLTHPMDGWTTCDFMEFFFCCCFVLILFLSYHDDGKKII